MYFFQRVALFHVNVKVPVATNEQPLYQPPPAAHLMIICYAVRGLRFAKHFSNVVFKSYNILQLDEDCILGKVPTYFVSQGEQASSDVK